MISVWSDYNVQIKKKLNKTYHKLVLEIIKQTYVLTVEGR